MREIKFRAWDDEHNTGMFYPLEWFFGNVAKAKHPAGKTIEVIPMQFTGLLDRNGVEIYEGDIVTRRGKNNELIGDIYFDNAMFRVRWGLMKDGRLADSGRSDGIHQYLSAQLGVGVGYDQEWEVIGNIMENPELLK